MEKKRVFSTDSWFNGSPVKAGDPVPSSMSKEEAEARGDVQEVDSGDEDAVTVAQHFDVVPSQALFGQTDQVVPADKDGNPAFSSEEEQEKQTVKRSASRAGGKKD